MTSESNKSGNKGEVYSSNNKNEGSYIETSNILEEKLSDMSFTLNFKEIIHSMDEKNEIE